MDESKPLRIVLTPEQREQLKRQSGHDLEAIEIASEDAKKGGGPLRFLWRLSAATGIPRQAWDKDEQK